MISSDQVFLTCKDFLINFFKQRGNFKMRYKLGSSAKLNVYQRVILGVLPILLILFLYGQKANHIDGVYNKSLDVPKSELTQTEKEVRSLYKILPTYSRMWEGITSYTKKSKRNPDKPSKLVGDVQASLTILLSGIAIVMAVSVIAGILLGTFPIAHATFMPTINVFSIVPPPATVPLLFVAFTPGFELSIVIIFIFLFFIVTKDIVNQLHSIPKNRSTLLLTKGASELEIAKANYKMIIPGILKTLQLNLPMAWVGVYFAETLGVEGGLGFRTFLLKRFVAHDIIIPYIVIVTLIAMVLFFMISIILKTKYRWYQQG